VPYVVPGDVVDLQVTRKKHSFMEAKVVKLHKPSEDRIAPVCQHFGVCGGCKWQCLKYERQLFYKQHQVVDTLTRIGKIELPEVKPIIGSRQTLRYRNKLEFSFSNKRWLTEEEISQDLEYGQKNGVGFHIPGAFDKVLDIEECFLMDDLQNKVRNGVKAFAIERGIEFFDLRNQQGVMRDMIFRTSNSGEVMLTMQFHITNNDEHRQANDVMNYIADSFPEITTLVWVNNLKCNDTIGDLDINIYKGRGYVYELMEDLKFKVGPKSFYQTNNEQAYELYKVVRDFAMLSGSQLVYDLYTGTGTIANFVAKSAAKVIGIEYVADAIEDAKINSALNGISNTQFYAGDMKDVLTDEFVAANGKPDVVITDPPRAGMHQDVINVILKSSPDRIVYVSCNPATQARDLALLDGDYRVEAYQPVDMFPHTHHIENVVLLKRR
ncbi:MAG: 23S rRNA (uracil(1939)-C(5))-methyltransferase RlmD, partial [Bacteroidaceae bacterium]